MQFIITVDTEADNQWETKAPVTTRNIAYLKRFQSLCEQYGFLPTYLVTHEVAIDKEAVALLGLWQRDGKAEIGAHLHPWTTPPEAPSDVHHSFPSELSNSELQEKLQTLTDTIEKNFGVQPLSYRAGRWGFDDRQARLLNELGYRVDSSVTPSIDWRMTVGDPDKEGGPDYRTANVHPYIHTGQLLEVPMTILPTGIIKHVAHPISRYVSALQNGLCRRVLNRIFTRIKWLRVFDTSSIRDWRALYVSAEKNNLPYMQFMIHSSELMPGGSPYATTNDDVERLYERIEELFAFMQTKQASATFLGNMQI